MQVIVKVISASHGNVAVSCKPAPCLELKIITAVCAQKNPELDGIGAAGFCLLCILEMRKLRLCILSQVSQLVKRQSRDSFLQLHIALGEARHTHRES